MTTALRTIFISLLLGACNYAHSGEIARYYQKMNDLIHEKKNIHMVQFLGELDTQGVWSFGAGLGPTDSQALQLNAIENFEPYLFDEKGNLKLSKAEQKILRTNSNTLKWAEILSFKSDDRKRLLEILNDENPAVRWIGIKKATLTRPDETLVGQLQNIAKTDKFVQVQRRQIKTKNNRPSPPGLTVNELNCPLRQFACDALSAWGITCTVDEASVAKRGVEFLAGMYVRNKAVRQSVMEAVNGLNPKGTGVLTLNRIGARAEPSAPVAQIYNDPDYKRRPSP